VHVVVLGVGIALARRPLVLAGEPRRRRRRRHRCGHGSQEVLPVVREQGTQAAIGQRRVE
jgi:hypothetical protein